MLVCGNGIGDGDGNWYCSTGRLAGRLAGENGKKWSTRARYHIHPTSSNLKPKKFGENAKTLATTMILYRLSMNHCACEFPGSSSTFIFAHLLRMHSWIGKNQSRESEKVFSFDDWKFRVFFYVCRFCLLYVLLISIITISLNSHKSAAAWFRFRMWSISPLHSQFT